MRDNLTWTYLVSARDVQDSASCWMQKEIMDGNQGLNLGFLGKS